MIQIYVKTPRDASGMQREIAVQVSRMPSVGEKILLPSSLHWHVVSEVRHYACETDAVQPMHGEILVK